jgi:hypothetical protein
MQRKLSADWTKHLRDSKEKKEFEAVVKSSSFLLKRLFDILSEYENEIDKMEMKLDAYDSPSWACKQAHLNGRRQSLHRIKELVTLND